MLNIYLSNQRTFLQPSACYYRFTHIFNHQHAITVSHTSSTISMLLPFHTHLQPSACYYSSAHIFNPSACYYRFTHIFNHQHAITVSNTSSTISMLLQFHTHLQPSACYYSSIHIFNHQHAITISHTSSTHQHAITVPYTSSTISMLLQFHTHLQPSACYYNFTHIFNHQHAITDPHTSLPH